MPNNDMPSQHMRALQQGFINCHYCNTLTPFKSNLSQQTCSHCGATLHQRKKKSLSRTWALLISAMIFYIPANLLPVMITTSITGKEQNTILGGIIYFWNAGEWALASVVFIASFLVPLFKMSVLSILLISIHLKIKQYPIQRTRLYRLVEQIGRWSMLDVFVILLSVLLVNFKTLISITIGPGAFAFAAVVILTMFASMQFDPRLIWDQVSLTADH